MPKRIWVLNYKTDDLQSVENISAGLAQLYLNLPDRDFNVSLLTLEDTVKSEGREWRLWLERFKLNPPDHVAVIHPSVNHHIFFHSLLSLSTTPQFIFHVFGNFFRNGESWFRMNHLLENKNVEFVAASHSYHECLQHFVSKASLSLLPFPLKNTSSERVLSAKSEKINILYTGRYHEQKNISLLIKKLDEVSISLDKKIQLNLAITFDDFNPTTLNEKKKLGTQFKKFLQAKHECKSVNVDLIPYQEFQALQNLYRENDLFISFSTFLDEDFGCSVLEALSCGTPCIVTGWGGYKDFARALPEFCHEIKVDLENEAFVTDFKSLDDSIKKLSALRVDEREKMILAARDLYSQEQLQIKLKSILKKKNNFPGFKLQLKEFVEHLGMFDQAGIELFKKYYSSFWQTK